MKPSMEPKFLKQVRREFSGMKPGYFRLSDPIPVKQDTGMTVNIQHRR